MKRPPVLSQKEHTIFLSHASYDAQLARHLSTILRSKVGAGIFMLPDDAPAGSDWMEQIKKGLATCNQLVSVLTPESINRPWITAEWACFGLGLRKNATCTCLLYDVSIDDMWKPMSRYQSFDLAESDQVQRFLESIANITGIQPVEGLATTSILLGKEVADIRKRTKIRQVDRFLDNLKKSRTGSVADVSQEEVEVIIDANRLPEAMALFEAHEATDMKRRQFGEILIRLRRLDDALRIARFMENRAEIKNIAVHVVHRLLPAEADSAEWQLLQRLHPLLGENQVRVVKAEMRKLDIPPCGLWAEGE